MSAFNRVSAPDTTSVLPNVGIIGMGVMGKMYADRISAAGWRVNACDRGDDKYQDLKREYAGRSDYIIYSVEAEVIGKVVSQFGPSTKLGAIVGGQTSCKAPEMAAFEKYLPEDVQIVSCHSLHGPDVDTTGQPLVLIKHRASQHAFDLVESILTCFHSKHVYLTAEEHDRITADTQAVTHAAFLSMGTAWRAHNQFPWEMARYVGGIENVKINVTLRIYSGKWHVYAGLAILNPWAKLQIKEYAKSTTELYKLMLGGRREELEKRVKAAGAAVFKHGQFNKELLLSDEVLEGFAVGDEIKERMPNNHLSLLAMVDCWWRLGIVPYEHMICSTPLFRLRLGVTEYLFRKPALLDEVIRTAIDDHTFRSDDFEFTLAARDWSDCVSFGDFAFYRNRFEKIQKHFEPRFKEAKEVGDKMIQTISEGRSTST